MFEILVIVVSRVLLVLLGFMVYRILSNWQGFHNTLIGRSGSGINGALAGQKGFVRVGSPGGAQKYSVKMAANLKIQSPWGW